MSIVRTAAWLLAAAGTLELCYAHPQGVPRLQGRRGKVFSVDDLPDLTRRAYTPGVIIKRQGPGGTCGPTSGGYSCSGNLPCCSQYGYCGNTPGHCQAGCQTLFGTCEGEVETTTSSSATPTSTTSSPTSVPSGLECGPDADGRRCPGNECCSEEGYCGTDSYNCQAPGCQVGFGVCDADVTPAGADTGSIPRPPLGSIDYGWDLFDCVVPGTVALTYDDGPDRYTDGMLDVLARYGARATFFVTGVNNGKGAIDTTPAWSNVIKRMVAGGHQIASHTWSHADLSELEPDGIKREMVKLEMALRNILGYFPTYMRPPYSKCYEGCRETMAELGYHITYFSIDTDDYNNNTPETIGVSKNIFFESINPSIPQRDAWLVIAHDIHQQTAQNLTEYMLQTLRTKGYRAVTLGECLNDPSANWYRNGTVVGGPGTSATATATATVTVTAVITQTAVVTATSTRVTSSTFTTTQVVITGTTSTRTALTSQTTRVTVTSTQLTTFTATATATATVTTRTTAATTVSATATNTATVTATVTVTATSTRTATASVTTTRSFTITRTISLDSGGTIVTSTVVQPITVTRTTTQTTSVAATNPWEWPWPTGSTPTIIWPSFPTATSTMWPWPTASTPTVVWPSWPTGPTLWPTTPTVSWPTWPTVSPQCAVKKDNWCAPPVPAWSTTQGCWDSSGVCYETGNVCYQALDWTQYQSCVKWQDLCAAIQVRCKLCVDINGTGDGAKPCANMVPNYSSV